MRGKDEQQLDVFSYVSPEQRVPQDHPLRLLRAMTDEALQQLKPRFNKLYAKTGRPLDSTGEAAAGPLAASAVLGAQRTNANGTARLQSVVPVVRGLEHGRHYLGCDRFHQEPRAPAGWGYCRSLLPSRTSAAGIVAERSLLSDEHFTVDGTLLEAWAVLKSFQRKGAKNAAPLDDPGNATVDFHGEKRSNETHASKTDPDAKMARKGKGKEAKLSYNGNLLVENRNGLIVNTEVFEANGTAERDAALVMLEQIAGTKQVTVGGDKGYDTADFVAECRNLKVTPHVAQNLERPGGSAIDARTTQHAGYVVSQRKRKRIEECFGWLKTIALLRKVRHRGIFKVGWVFTFAAAAYNLVRMRNLAIQAT